MEIRVLGLGERNRGHHSTQHHRLDYTRLRSLLNAAWLGRSVRAPPAAVGLTREKPRESLSHSRKISRKLVSLEKNLEKVGLTREKPRESQSHSGKTSRKSVSLGKNLSQSHSRKTSRKFVSLGKNLSQSHSRKTSELA